MSVVLVTGGSGFVGSHTVIQLLAAGHSVRTTVRSTKREPDVRGMLAAAGCEPGDRLSFHVADLEKDDGWAEATAGCDYVHHIASPFPAGEPKHEDELIVPAREGALRALRAARDAKVKRVVLTSSFAAIGYGNDPGRPYTEEDWTDPADPRVLAYPRSKTIAERSAWDFIAREGEGLELAVVNPVGIFGPVLGADFATSILLLQRMLNGKIPGCPRLWFGAVDVRDVAGLHLLAMTHPEARGAAVPGHGGGLPLGQGGRRHPPEGSRRDRQEGPQPGVSGLARPGRRVVRPRREGHPRGARQAQERPERQGEDPPRVGPAEPGRGHPRERREPRPAWPPDPLRRAAWSLAGPDVKRAVLVGMTHGDATLL